MIVKQKQNEDKLEHRVQEKKNKNKNKRPFIIDSSGVMLASIGNDSLDTSCLTWPHNKL